MTKKYFPIKTGTACQLKWAWSTIYLNSGITRSCHRTAESVLTPENFDTFHNTEIKISDRKDMLQGLWPEKNCSYCHNIEDNGGFSDRMLHLTIPDMYPAELDADPTAVSVVPTILEVFFNNTCNLSCLYCNPTLSSKTAEEYRKYGPFVSGSVSLLPVEERHYKSLVPAFWRWMETHHTSLKRLHILGGEPFYQREMDILLDKISESPMPDCEINVVSNLMVSNKILSGYVRRFKRLVATRKIKRLDITASIDCWGPEQEYVRNGLKLEQWEENFEYLLSNSWIKLNINQTISPLTIKTMPELIKKLNGWKAVRNVGHYFGGVAPGPNYMKAGIFGPGVFDQDFSEVLSLMKRDTDEEKTACSYMQGIANEICNSKGDPELVKDFFVYLDEVDRRKGNNWRTTFPWLVEIKNNVV